MTTLFRLATPTLVLLGAAQAQPTIQYLRNNSSQIASPLPGSGIAQGSIFQIKGANLGPAAFAFAALPFPADLAGASIRISASGNDVSAYLIYTSAEYLAAILPSRTPLGPALARVTYNGQQSQPFAFNVVRNSPGIGTLSGSGTGPAILTTPEYKLITYTYAAVEGDSLSAWGTGLTGLQGRPDNTAAEFFDPQLSVEVIVGGKQANVRYRGRAPGLAGVDQIVFEVPSGVRGCNVSLVLKVGGAISNFSTLAVAGANRLCSDPNGLREADVSKALQGGLRLGTISLNRTSIKTAMPGVGSIQSRSDSAFADFTRYDADGFIRSQGVGGTTLGNCVLSTFDGETAPTDPFTTAKLNAGAQLTLNGPGGTRSIVRDARSGFYNVSLGTAQVIPGVPTQGNTLFLEPGTYTVTGPGGPDVGTFNARLTVPQPLTTNLDSIATVSRGSALNVTWSGGAASEYIFISGFSARRNPTVGAVFTCTERASAGRFQVPAEVLLAMPPSDVIQGAALGSLSVSSIPYNDATRFTASGLDLGFIIYSTVESKSVPYQ